ncbi:MAG TPA: hypothetical protein EYG86_02420 [Crocinitomicaceae bacterium]|nr:hypothetical protein [Crocinitomicaceae bacterium]
MEKFARSFFSMKMMTLGLFIFLAAIATATFIESSFDIDTAKKLIYNALWFELLLFYLGLNLIANIVRYKMWQKEKIAMFMFHLSFIIILIGAAITRFYSFEGLMLIREGKTVSHIYSSDANLWYKINDGKLQYTNHRSLLMSTHSLASNDFEEEVEFPNHATPISIKYVDYQKELVDSLIVNDSIKSSALEIVTGGMTSSFLSENDFLMLGDIAMSFEKDNEMPGISLSLQGNKVMMRSQYPLRYLPMAEMRKARMSGEEVADSLYEQVAADSLVQLQTTTLYQVADQQFVFKGIKKHAKMMRISSGKRKVGVTVLTVKVSDGEQSKNVELEGGQGMIPDHVVFDFAGLTYEMEFGAMKIQLPFGIRCNDFILDKYPGSDMASSFESELTIIDEKNNYKKDAHVFMNNVIDYGGYRFFQSSYDEDEGGTHLSVNHDWWGTNITYLGYLMMSIGMIFTLFAPAGRFKELMSKLKKSREKRAKMLPIIIGMMMFSSTVNAQDTIAPHAEHDHSQAPEETVFRVMSEEHSEELATLLVQDFQGRIAPMHTICDQLLRKIYKKDQFESYNAIQTIFSMHMYPSHWTKQEVIYVSSKSNLRKKLGMKSAYISYENLLDQNGAFKLTTEYQEAHQRLEKDRNEFDKRLIKLVERFQVAESIFSWRYMKIVPARNDASQKWYVPLNMELVQKDSLASGYALNYFTSLDKGAKDNSFGKALNDLNKLKNYQKEVNADIIPAESQIAQEINYNKMHIFSNTYKAYILLGFIMLIIFFIRIFVKPTEGSAKFFTVLTRGLLGVAIILFAYHGYGIYLRAIVSGHTPWSNGYEAVIFIAWITVLFGLIFSSKNPVVLAGALILSSLMIFVTELELMDPEITQLPPVLKSYWLKIHVAIITGSYAPLGLSFILGFINLMLYILRTKKNSKIINLNINELTWVSEITMTIGLFMLAIGTFLGGVWANESWGRYWGWDPKETWALVAVLVYAVILHLRFIPALKNKFLFNTVSVWGYASILFTFFGVNFYLTGLHSYAQGEGLTRIPDWVFSIFYSFILFTLIAIIRNAMFKSAAKKDLINHE